MDLKPYKCTFEHLPGPKKTEWLRFARSLMYAEESAKAAFEKEYPGVRYLLLISERRNEL